MELQSVYDGVAGWSRTDSRVAPLLAPGDSFDVFIRPPRAGTFIYHSHMDELRQVTQGMYGPLLVLVLEPGQRFDPERDRLIVIADAIDGDYHATSGSPVVLGECIAEAVADIPDVRFARQCGMIVHRAPFHSQKAAWTPSCFEHDLSSVSPCSWPPRLRWPT
jgi:hypothetical protein